MPTFEDLEKNNSPAKMLKLYDFPVPLTLISSPVSLIKRYFRNFLIALTIIITIAAYWLKDKDAAGIVLGIGAFLIAFQQWREARYESSLDKYYERLDLANSRLERIPGVNLFVMYVYMELDNLEYIIEKYKLGYIQTEQAFRGLKTFHSHCRNIDNLDKINNKSEKFRDMALDQVQSTGYHETTIKVVKKVHASFPPLTQLKK